MYKIEMLRRVPAFDVLVRIVLLLYLALLAFPFRFSLVSTGLDPSWIFAINYFFHNNFIFGRDVFWTYGPLGFLAYPLNVGSNLDVATVVQLLFWSVFVMLVFYLSFKNYFTLLQLFLFVILFAGGQAVYYMGYIGYDYFLSFLVLLFLALSFSQKKWHAFYIVALCLSTLLMFIKCSSAAMSLIAVVSFVLALVFIDKRKALKAAWLALSIPVLFYIIYMIYYPSLSALIAYLQGTYELISGNNIAMSLAGSRTELLAALLVFILYTFLIILLYRTRRNSFIFSVMFTGPLFVAFKHGFVRQDTHTIIFFSFALFVVGIVLLFADIKKFIRPAACLVAGFLVLWLFVCLSHAPARLVFSGISGIITFRNMTAAANFDKTKNDLNAISREELNQDMLTGELMQRIGTRTIGIFPWEISYAAANKLNYVPSPVFQTDNAYTSYLDSLNAGFMEDREKAPVLVLMEWKAVDGRHPLIDVPAMWLSMYKWYDTYHRENEILTLKRRSVPRFNNLELIGKKIAGTGKFVELPDMETPLIMKVSLPLNALGRCSKVLFRIDEVRMQLVMESGRTEDYRIIPDTLGDGLFINFLPVNISDAESLLEGDKIDRVREFKLHGKGLKMYKKMMTVEFYKIPSHSQNFGHNINPYF